MLQKEPKTASFYVAYVIKKLWTIIALSLVVLAVAISAVRYSLPYMNEQKHYIENWLSEQVGAQITIGTITAKWQGAGPAIVLENLALVESEQSPIKLSISETSIEVDFWQSVLAKQVQSNKFDLRNVQLTIELDSLRKDDSDYPIVDALEKLFLQQLQLFSISDSRIVLNTPRDQQVVLIDQVSWVNKNEHHQGVGQLQVQEIASNSASFVLDLYGGKEALKGTFYAKGEDVDLSPWVQQWMNTPHELLESRGSFVMWADIDDASVNNVQLDLSNSRFKWETSSGKVNASVLGGQIRANPKGGDWLFNLDNLTVQINEQVMVTNWLGKLDYAGDLLLQHQQDINLTPLLDLLPLAIDTTELKKVSALDPTATLNSLSLQHAANGEWTVNASASDVSWLQSDMLPGLQGIDAEFSWHGNKGILNLKSKSGLLEINNILSDDLAYQRLVANIRLEVNEHGWLIASEDVIFKSNLVSLRPRFFYRSQDQYFVFSSRIEPLDVELLPKLYPSKLMGAETRSYLVGALQSGNITQASVLWQGSFNDYPFNENQGVFQASVEIENGQFKFTPEWPALTELDIELLFENQGLSMSSQQGRLMDVDLISMSADIPKLANGAVLTIDAIAHAKGKSVTELILQSNLVETLGATLQQVQVSGDIQTELNLHIPLTGTDVVASGQINLANNQVLMPDLDLTLRQANGVVSFKNDGVSFEQLNANLLGQPIRVSFDGVQQEQGYQANIKLEGQWQVVPLLEGYYPNLIPYLSGQSDWLANVDLTLLKQGYLYAATISSELSELSSSLPFPFAKSSQQSMPLIATSQGNQHASTIQIKLGEQIEFNGNLPHQDMQFSRAHLSIGETDIAGMGLGFSVSARLPNIDAYEWYQVLDNLISDLPNQGKPLIDAPKRIFISTDSATVASQRLTDLDIVAKNTSESWLLDINAKEARMEVALYKDWLSKGVNVNADFIQIAQWQEQAGEPIESKSFTPKLDNLPPINFSCSRCQYFDMDLGKVDVSLSRSATGMSIDNVRLKNAHGVFNGDGDWFLTEGDSSTRLKGEFTSSDFGAFLAGFDFNSGIKDSEASATFDLSWQRAPYEFNFDSLNGQINWHLSDGYLTEVTDKGSRIFSLLSLESLVRKLTLDFRDVFAKGFFYDKIDGSFQLQNGVADTQDIVVDGGAGEIIMRGYTDLVAQELNYRIEFAPKVTSSLPVIVAWMVNPATALAALAIDQVLTSAKVISNIEFSLTGTFEKPQLKELGRDSKEITLPARARPEQQPAVEPVDKTLVEPVNIQISTEVSANG